MPQKRHNSTTHRNKRTIVIVDDHPIVRQGLAQLINQETDLEVRGQAEDAHEAMETIRRLDPDRVGLCAPARAGASGDRGRGGSVHLHPARVSR